MIREMFHGRALTRNNCDTDDTPPGAKVLSRRAIRHPLATLLLALGLAAGAVSGAAAQPAETETANGEELITPNFRDVDINALISTVAEFTGKNFIVDPRVRANITLVSHRPIAADEFYKVFQSILQVHGFAAVEGDDVIKIIPDVNAKQVGAPLGLSTAGDEIVTEIITVRNVPVAQLVPILRPLVPQQGHLAAYPPSNALIISDRSGNVERIRDIVASIDRTSDDEVEVIRLQHASAAELVRIIATLEQQQQDDPSGRIRLAADERTNSILISGESPTRMRIRALIAHLDSPVEGTGDTRVVYLRYARAADLVQVITGVSEDLPEGGQEDGPGNGGSTSIHADEATNALVITAPPAVQRQLEAIIRQLDIRRAQILVEAAIAEITSARGLDLGIEIAGFDNDNGGAFGSLFSEHQGGIRSVINPQTGEPSPALLSSGLSAVLGDLNGRFRFGAFVRALAADANSNILSTPSIVTLDNQEAEIRVARNVPFVTGSYTGVGTDDITNPFTTVQREDVGVILKITPQINEGDAVTMAIEQEVSNIVSSGQLGPETNRRSIMTSILVEDGQMIALGGLIDDAVDEGEQRVPLLGDLPLLGHLFRARTTSVEKRNLMLFLQPTILRDRASADHVSQRKYNFIRAEQLEQQRRGIGLMPNEVAPVLPRLERPALPQPFEP